MQHEPLTVKQAVAEFAKSGVVISSNTFRRKVKDANQEILPDGAKRGARYSRDFVYGLIEKERTVSKEKRHKQQPMRETIPVDFIKVSPEQMPEMVPVLESVFTGSPHVERWQAWIRRNPDIAYMLRVDGRVVGVGLIVPLKHHKILDILAHQVTPPTDPSEILDYVPGVPTDLYVRSVGIIATATRAERRRWAAILVRGFYKVFADLGARGVVINRIYSRSETADGKRILRHAGFTEIPSVTNHSDYVIDAPSSGLKIIKLYKEALTNWQEQNVGE